MIFKNDRFAFKITLVGKRTLKEIRIGPESTPPHDFMVRPCLFPKEDNDLPACRFIPAHRISLQLDPTPAFTIAYYVLCLEGESLFTHLCFLFAGRLVLRDESKVSCLWITMVCLKVEKMGEIKCDGGKRSFINKQTLRWA